MTGPLTYRDSGVDIDAGDAFVSRIAPLAAATRRAGVMGGVGGFASVFDPRATGYTDPLIVAATDGVGTKLELAGTVGDHGTIGIDLVAMCVNDLLAQGAEPVFFLDYLATGALEPAVLSDVVASVAEGCRRAGCALVGGETAEMPGLYAAGTYDVAGFAVGLVERGDLLPRIDQVLPGDVLLGLASDGVHSNGFSLVRRVVATAGADLSAPAPFDLTRSLGASLLTPTRIYVLPVLAALRAHPGAVRALAHITGGGLPGNLPRVLPAGMQAQVAEAAWPTPPVFDWLAEAGPVAREEMRRVFNAGLGMVLVVAAEAAEGVAQTLRDAGERVNAIGQVVAADDPQAPAQVVYE